jgi:putative flippase GtrA
MTRNHDYIGQMDADLSHDPSVLPALFHAIAGREGAALGSRYVPGGGSEGWPLRRRLLSRGANLYARILLRLGVHDATSGFRVYSRHAISLLLRVGTECDGYGFQVEAICILRRLGLDVIEVPITFVERRYGESKMTRTTAVEAARRVAAMAILDPTREHPDLRPAAAPLRRRIARFGRFAVVGISGVFVNQLTLWVATEGLEIYYVHSAVLATQASTVSNFALSERWVFRSGRDGRSRRLLLFALMNNAWLLLRAPLLYLLTDGVGVHYLVSNLVVLGAATVARFAVADTWIWRPHDRSEGRDRYRYRYDVHGIVRIGSEAPLPELQRFRVEGLDAPLDLTITIDGAGFGGPRRAIHVERGDRSMSYVEHLGRFGFAIRVDMGAVTVVRATSLLGRSPHVLYTNVVEPLVRWILVRKGHALVHSACLEFDRQGVLMTAQTDTGKTTTCLHSVRSAGSTFVSDDMVILTPGGEVLAYPKPLTISAHTMKAVAGTALRPRERLFLQIQSRIHSRSGRKAAMAMSNGRLPVATLNALVQILVPPPKFDITRLLPRAVVRPGTSARQLFVIERGATLVEPLSRSQAAEILSENTEDAFGFPPYPQLRSMLSEGLAEREAEIRARMLAGVTTYRIRTADRHWYEQLRVICEGRLVSTMEGSEGGPVLHLVDETRPVVDVPEAPEDTPTGTGGDDARRGRGGM